MRLGQKIKSLAGAALILAGIGFVGSLTLSNLKSRTAEIVRDTLPGLSYAGEFNTSMAASFNRMLLLIITDDPAGRTEYEAELAAYSQKTTDYLARYEATIFGDLEDRRNYNELIRVRAEYLKTRDELIGLVHQGKKTEALAAFKSRLMPQYAAYTKSAATMLEYNIQQGQARGEHIMLTCTVTQIVVAVIGVIFFMIGFWLAILSPTDEEKRLMGDEVESNY